MSIVIAIVMNCDKQLYSGNLRPLFGGDKSSSIEEHHVQAGLFPDLRL